MRQPPVQTTEGRAASASGTTGRAADEMQCGTTEVVRGRGLMMISGGEMTDLTAVTIRGGVGTCLDLHGAAAAARQGSEAARVRTMGSTRWPGELGRGETQGVAGPTTVAED